MSETSNDRFKNPTLQHALETPLRGGSQEDVDAEAARIAAANTPNTAPAVSQPETAGRHKANRQPMSKGAKLALKIIAPVVAVGVATGATAVATDGFNFKSETTQGSDPSEGTNGNGGIEGNTITIEVSPESLAELSSPEQITEALSISTVNAEGQPMTEGEYLTELEQNLEGLLNSGTTAAEYAPYENTPIGEYENAMHEKYDAAGLSALFVNPLDVAWIGENHKGNVNLAKTSRSILETGEFKQNVDITLEDASTEDAPVAGADMTISITYLSNAEELGLVDHLSGTPQDIEGIDRTESYTVKVVDDGNGHLKAQLDLIEG